VHSEPFHRLTLYQCSLKADKFEWILQKGTELGVSVFVPVISQRSVVRPESALLKKYDRWHTILREAAEQCGRGRLPHVG
jgi:16S rRNA (uracil1498-N3)-methyltransferase